MNTRYIKQLLQRPLILGIAIVATFVTGIILALIMYSLLLSNIAESPSTTASGDCQIELTVVHDLYDTREDYWENALPIGKLESGIYGVIGTSDDLLAIDWRGDIDVHPPTLELIDWIFPIESVNNMSGNCTNVTRFTPISPSLTAVP